MNIETPTRLMGRPRDAEADERIMDAVLHELAEAPYSKLRVDDVARRAGVAKTTLYRRYPTKVELVRCAIEHYFASHFFTKQDGDITEILQDALQQQVDEFATGVAGPALANLAADTALDPELKNAIRRTDKRAELTRAFEAAKQRGELRDEVDPDLLVDFTLAVFPYRLIVMGAPIPDDFARRATELLLHGAASGSDS